MTQEQLNKACEWLEEHWGDYYAPVEYRKLTDAFRKAMGKTVTNCHGLTWQDIERIIDIWQHTNKLTTSGETRSPEDVFKDVLERFTY